VGFIKYTTIMILKRKYNEDYIKPDRSFGSGSWCF
jgi:hypothetical protein